MSFVCFPWAYTTTETRKTHFTSNTSIHPCHTNDTNNMKKKNTGFFVHNKTKIFVPFCPLSFFFSSLLSKINRFDFSRFSFSFVFFSEFFRYFTVDCANRNWITRFINNMQIDYIWHKGASLSLCILSSKYTLQVVQMFVSIFIVFFLPSFAIRFLQHFVQ